MIDYIVVGAGLGGIAFCEQLEKHGKSFVVFDDNSQQSSNVAGGMYNPVILKRFTAVWRAQEQLALLAPFYAGLERKLAVKLNYELPIWRRLGSIEEQNLWFEATDKPTLQPFMSTQLVKNSLTKINAPFGYGVVKHTGRIDTHLLQTTYLQYLKKQQRLKEERFDYSAVHINNEGVLYKGIKAKRVVFCEGFGLKSNPFFNYLPLNGTKGELLEIQVPGLELDVAIKAAVFLLPLGAGRFKVGATYKWKDKTNTPTEASKKELEEKLQAFLKHDYKVIDHVAGIRPTVADRRPLVGKHPKHSPVYVLNGLGSRGVMIAPYVAEQLFQCIENEKPLEPEIDIDRFRKKFMG